MREYIKNVAMHYNGDYHKMKQHIEKRKSVPTYKSNYPYIVIGDDAYPKRLFDLKLPPYILFYIGDTSLLKKDSVSIVGSRRPSQYALEMSHIITSKLRESYVIVSGLAKGIDQAAHHSALAFSTIAVVGCGIDVIYPKCNTKLFEKMRQTQLIISEYPQGVSPKKYYFPFRNRIIAALSETLYVMSAAKRSGTMTTVNEALSINRHVVCLPHNINEKSGEGCNQLILEGADILTSVHDL